MNKPKIVILGCNGMLGHAVSRYFATKKDDYIVSNYSRKNGGIKQDSDLRRIIGDDHDYVINCIGVIKPFMKKENANFSYINGEMPYKLAEISNKLIHITTDCVFSGDRGQYTENDEHDCADDYGKSKSAGEPSNNCMVLRTSIIGEEIRHRVSLIEWAKSQRGKTVNGFTNHLWNGVTTTTFANICDQIIKNDLYQHGLFHIYSNTISKYELLHLLNKKFNLNLTIKAIETDVSCDRSLSSNRDLIHQLDIPSIENQIINLPEHELYK